MQWNSFATDLEANFLNALEIRFNVNQAQRDFINQIMLSQKELITCNIRKMANYLNQDPYAGKMVQGITMGINENPPPQPSKIEVKATGKIEKDFTTGATKGSVEVSVSC